jgi:AraC-like DNA-binding protein
MVDISLLILQTSLLAIAFFCMLVTSLVLLSAKDGRSPANRFLVFFLVTMSVAMLMLFLIRSGLIAQMAWLYRLPSPLYYWMFPAAFLYVRMVLLDETRVRKSDFLHAIPGLIHIVEMAPYYLSSIQAKADHVNQDLGNPLGAVAHAEGLLPAYWHNLLRGFIGVFYALLMIRLLWIARSRRPRGSVHFSAMTQWLWVHTTMLLIFSLALVYTFSFPKSGSAYARSTFLYLALAGTQIVTSLYLLLNPSILFGMPRLEKLVERLNAMRNNLLLDHTQKMGIEPMVDSEMVEHKPVSITNFADAYEGDENDNLAQGKPSEKEAQRSTSKEYQDYINMLGKLMHEQKPFLRKRYSIHDLASDVKIPRHHLSYLLNNIFQVRFSDYINQLRIQYLENRMAVEDLSNMTLEGLAIEAGFSSRITFIRAVQKQTGMNPSAYFKLVAKGEEEESGATVI